jgi:hypothetical protein
MNELTAANAVVQARALLDRLPPATEPVRAIEPAVDCGWCFVVYWSLAHSADAPPPGAGPIVVPKTGGAAFYLGSHDLESELERARLRYDLGT